MKNEKRLKRRGFDSGYTLLEVLVATLVITVALSGLMSAFMVASKQTGTTINRGSAAFYQKRIMDELRRYVVEDWASYTPLSDIRHSCDSSPPLGNPHYILEDSNGSLPGATVHEAIRVGGAPMIPATDDLITKFHNDAVNYALGEVGVVANYTVGDLDANGNIVKQINVQVNYMEGSP